MKDTLLDLIELAYHLDLDEADWHRALTLRAADYNPYSDAALFCSFDVSVRDSSVAFSYIHSVGISDDIVRTWLELGQSLSEEQVDSFFRGSIRSATISEAIGLLDERDADQLSWLTQIVNATHRDWYFLTVPTPDLHGVLLIAPIDEVVPLDARTRLASMQLGVHLRSAVRLRRSLRQGVRRSGPATTDERNDQIQGTADATDRFRQIIMRQQRIEADQEVAAGESAKELWNGLVDGRWSMVQQFDVGNRRLLVATASPKEITDARALTPRERDIVRGIAAGQTNKHVAYSLSVSPGTVAKLLSSSLRKLGLRSRSELVWLFHLLEVG